MFKKGLVHEVDTAAAKARVIFHEYDEHISWWLDIGMPLTASRKAYVMPVVGEAVWVMLDDKGEDGCILAARYTEATPPPIDSADKYHVVMQDGATFEYDQATSKLMITLPASGTLEINAPAGGKIIAPEGFEIDATNGGGTLRGQWTIDKGLDVAESITAGGDVSDRKSSMDDMRDTYNGHKHKPTDPAPIQKMT